MKQLKRLIGDNKARISTQKMFCSVLDVLVERDVLTQFSWTGIAKKGEKKAFNMQKNILDVLFQVIFAADRSYTIKENEKFMHQVLRNSLSRCNQVGEKKR